MLNDPVKQTLAWINSVVVGLNLCPFAESVLTADTVSYTVCTDTDDALLLRAILQQLEMLNSTDTGKISTSLLILSHAKKDFDQYLSLADAANELLAEAGLEGVIQIATFHPDYCFDGEDESDASNYSNRAPYPMLHFLRESQLAQALSGYVNPEQIPQNNINRLRQLGVNGILALTEKQR